MLAAVVAVAVLCTASLTEGCGKRSIGARVVGGVDALPHSWPWQISLRVGGRHICGGSLIKPDWVVTAAHCVAGNTNPRSYTVVVGAHVRTGKTTVQKTHSLKKVIRHEKYNPRRLNNDIALLQLSSPVQLSDKVNVVCLPKKGTKVAPGKKCYITGWGRTVGGGPAADILQQAQLPVQSHSVCDKRNSYLVPVDEATMVCAGSGVAGNGGGCQGDSGGPFVCEENGSWVLRGAVSWGHSMCRTDHFTVFARVSNFLDWIGQKTSGGSGGGGVCQDKSPRCKRPAIKRKCRKNRVKKMCPKTCNIC